jgi:hypothetical protein
LAEQQVKVVAPAEGKAKQQTGRYDPGVNPSDSNWDQIVTFEVIWHLRFRVNWLLKPTQRHERLNHLACADCADSSRRVEPRAL